MLETLEKDDFYEAIEAASTSPLWRRFSGSPPSEPTPQLPFIWRWETLFPLTERAANEVPMEDVERRVLTLDNPQFNGPGPGTTRNLVGALQTLLPGETAEPHRHSGNALRFVMHGNGAETIVNGKYCLMNERDLILTPLWSWHAHQHNAGDRIVWFDSLDIPLFRHMNSAFFEEGPPPNLPPSTPDDAFAEGGLMPPPHRMSKSEQENDYSPMFRYSWDAILRAFENIAPEADGSKILRYVNPATGGPAMTLIDCYVKSLSKSQKTLPYRTTSEAICVVADGEGESQIGDEKIKWQRNDIFTLPSWNWISHNSKTDSAKLFHVTDRDVMERLGMLKEETQQD